MLGERVRFRWQFRTEPPGPGAPYAARMLAMKRLSSSRSRALSDDSDWAERNTPSEAEPVSVAPRLTWVMSVAAACVPAATLCTFRAISWVAPPCCETAVAIDEAMVEIWRMVPPICLIAATDSWVAACMPGMWVGGVGGG